MLRIFWNSKSAMIANQEKLDTISNNISNANTDGYKRVTVSFQDMVSETLNRKGYPISANANRQQDPYTGTGVKTSDWVRDEKQGVLIDTQKTTDFAIDGEGYFKITKADGSTVYSRAGRFDTDGGGSLVDSNGNKVTIDYKAGFNKDNVNFNKDNFSVSESGDVLLKGPQGYSVVGKIPIYTANGSDAFRTVGQNYYSANPGANVYEVDNPSIHQGYIEGSNVDMVTEMTDMMVTQRAFELGSRGIKAADDMWSMANNLKSR